MPDIKCLRCGKITEDAKVRRCGFCKNREKGELAVLNKDPETGEYTTEEVNDF